MRLPASESSLPILRQEAMDAAIAIGMTEADQLRVDLVLEEALVNVIRHAYPPGTPEPMLELECGLDPDGVLRLTLKDWGRAFDPVNPDGPKPDSPRPDSPRTDSAGPAMEAGDAEPSSHLLADLEANRQADLDDRAPGGLGLLFICSMSEASYARTDGANVLSLRFPPTPEE